MKKTYESPSLFLIRLEVEERMMVSVTELDEQIDNDSAQLPPINIFG